MGERSWQRNWARGFFFVGLDLYATLTTSYLLSGCIEWCFSYWDIRLQQAYLQGKNMASCERAASHVRQKGCCDVHGCLPFPKSTNLVWRVLHGQKEMSRNFWRKKKKNIAMVIGEIETAQWSQKSKETELRWLQFDLQAICYIDTIWGSMYRLCQKQQREERFFWLMDVYNGGRLYVVAAWKDYIALCLSILVHHRGLKNLR